MPKTTEISYAFSAAFDQAYLLEIHDNDLEAIADIFTTAHQQIESEIALSKPFAENGDSETLRQRFHRIKPLWGYAGLHYWQQHIQVFEDFCRRKPMKDTLMENYDRLVTQMEVGLSLLREESQRLRLHFSLYD